MAITPFTIHVPEEILVDLRVRLTRTRFPDTLEGVTWEDGTDTTYLRQLVAYWLDGYDWREEIRAFFRPLRSAIQAR